jgi:DNA replication protein DnaC
MHPQSISRVLRGAAAPDRQQGLLADLSSDTEPGSADLHPHVAAWPWRFEVYHPGLRAVLPSVQAFCSAVIRREQPRRWLSLLGPSGVGKTHVLKQALACLQSAAARGLWKIPTPTGHRGPQVAHLLPAVDLEDFRAARDYAKYDLIYIEDIGSGAALDKGAGAVTRSRIAELLQLRSGKWTLLDANLYRREIEQQIDGRIASRLKRDGSWMVEVPQEVPDFWDRIE